jgi:SWI/SNF-related matrix-associated actin-dependent regulator of chromatin subfamily A member 5
LLPFLSSFVSCLIIIIIIIIIIITITIIIIISSDTFLSEEAFFTESFLFHTVIIDEGHRLKNASCKLCKGLARLNTPFRVLLTGTPLQNCLAELIALLQYILPSVPIEEHLLSPPSTTKTTDNAETKGLDRALISQARILLESCMIRRIKSEVEASLLPKIEYVLKPPLTRLQRKWYRSFLESDGSKAMGLLNKNQLMKKVLQLGKVANHPKTIALTYDRERTKAASMVKRAQGSMFVKLNVEGVPQTPEAIASEIELRGLVGEKLVNSCGKLALLDRLMLTKKQQGSRVLVFSQFTLTLDVLEEYVKHRFGSMGVAYLRLDGTTGRIQREMDMRSYNKPGCGIFCYLISTRAGGQGINLATGTYNFIVVYFLIIPMHATYLLFSNLTSIFILYLQPILLFFTIHVGIHKWIYKHKTAPTASAKRNKFSSIVSFPKIRWKRESSLVLDRRWCLML